MQIVSAALAVQASAALAQTDLSAVTARLSETTTARLEDDGVPSGGRHRRRHPALHRAAPPLSHTAGIGLGDFTKRYAPEAVRPGLTDHLERDFRMVAVSGARFASSDTGCNTLELMIEECAGEDFAAFLGREVFAPLGMAAATYDWPGADMPVGHDLRERSVAPYVYAGRGSGGLFAIAPGRPR